MHGNAWEWCEDLCHDNYNGIPEDGSPWISGGEANRHPLRGGSWNINASDCRSALRSKGNTDIRYPNVGFRVVISYPTFQSFF
jgi:formylglycine-generating enzyme required for sulfatase activity